MRGLLNIQRLSGRCLHLSSGGCQTLRQEKLNQNINQTHQQQQNDNLKKLNQYMEYHKFSKAIKEIDRLTQQNIVDLPIQNILEKLVKNSEYEYCNKLYTILNKSQIKLSDISYNYLIDANLKFKNVFHAQNIAIHAYLSGVVLDIQAYKGLFGSISAETDHSYRQVLYKMYKTDFKLNTKILYDLALQAHATKDYDLMAELEEDTIKQGIKMPETFNKIINSRESNTTNSKKKLKSESELNDIKETAPITAAAATTTVAEKNEEIAEIKSEGQRSYGYQPVLPQEQLLDDELSFKNILNNNQIYNYQNLDIAGNDIFRFIKKGQKKGIFSSTQAPMIFVIKSGDSAEYDEYREDYDEEYNGEFGYNPDEGLNSYSDDESDE